MKTEEIFNQLQHIASSKDFTVQSSELAQEWSTAPNSFDAVEPILRFMETNPSLDYGMPGPLVHFVETFFQKGYEQKLLDSINRKPTLHTVWMLNRLINGTKEVERRQLLIETMMRSKDNALIDSATKDRATHYLARLSSLR